MSNFTEELKKAAKEGGVDLIGIAPIERFKDIPKEHNPSSIFPEVQSVIVIGKRITRGVIRGIEEGTQFDSYSLYGYSWLENRFLAMATFKTAEFLEDNKWESVPLPNIPVQVPVMGIPVRAGLPAPNVLVDFDDAAIRAGLGEIGYIDVFLSPEFGPRQRFQIILTDAKLDPTPICEKTICEPDKKFKEFCPLNAINTDKEKTINICGKKMVVATVDYKKCADCKNGALPNRYHPSANPDRLGALCVRNCVEHLEKSNRISNKFVNPFRRRKPWQITGNISVIEEGSEIE